MGLPLSSALKLQGLHHNFPHFPFPLPNSPPFSRRPLLLLLPPCRSPPPTRSPPTTSSASTAITSSVPNRAVPSFPPVSLPVGAIASSRRTSSRETGDRHRPSRDRHSHRTSPSSSINLFASPDLLALRSTVDPRPSADGRCAPETPPRFLTRGEDQERHQIVAPAPRRPPASSPATLLHFRWAEDKVKEPDNGKSVNLPSGVDASDFGI